MAATILMTMAEGVEVGLVVGVGLSFDPSAPRQYIEHRCGSRRSDTGTMSFRNVKRHTVATHPTLLPPVDAVFISRMPVSLRSILTK